MNGKSRGTAISVGVLYIIGTVSGIMSVVLSTPILESPEFLVNVATHETQFLIAAMFVFLMGLSLALIPVILFPILKKFNEVLAVGYVVFRGALETMTYIASVIVWLFLLAVGREYVANPSTASNLLSLGLVLKDGGALIAPVTGIVFGLGALMLYVAFYISKLIPRWISVWGVIAIILAMTASILVMFHLQSSFSTENLIMNSQIFLQEMVMAVWLIIKGFNLPAMKEKK